MEMDGLDEVYRHQRFLPTDKEALGHFLPRLLAGETLDGAEKLIHHADIYACEPKDLAAEYPPVPTAVSTGDRFFFTTCRRNKNGYFARVAGAGTWTVQTTDDVHDDKGVKIGEARTVSFKKQKKSTGWVMEEYRSLLPQAVVADGEKVLCRIHLANHPPAAARQESNAYKKRPEPAPTPQPAEPVTVMASAHAHAHKRPAPVAAAANMSSCKKMRIAAPVPVPEPEMEYPMSVAAADPPCSNKMWMSVPVPANAQAPASDDEEYEDCPVWFTPTAPVSTSPAASMEAPEAEDDTGRLSCSWEELFGEEQQEEQTLPVEHQVLDHGMEQLAAPVDVREEEQQLVSDQGMDRFVQSLFADDGESEAQHSEEQLAAPINWDWEQYFSDKENQLVASFLAELHEEEPELQKKMCHHNADLQGQQNSTSSHLHLSVN